MNERDGNVLIVDDEEHVREALHEMVRAAGFNSATAKGSKSALDFLKENPVDVVIADIQMPGMDGLALTACVRQQYDADVIIITGYSESHSYEEAISSGASDFILKPIRLPELRARLQRVFKERKLASEREILLKQLKKLAITDSLTSLYNRRHFFRQLDMEASRSVRYNRTLSLLFFDIDMFKKYNDIFGHVAGDRALQKIARTAVTCLRVPDSVFRYGGEEFTVILPETPGAQAVVAANRLKNDIANLEFNVEKGGPAKLTVSIGVTEYLAQEKTEECVKRVDYAMYVAKRAGGSQVHYLPPIKT